MAQATDHTWLPMARTGDSAPTNASEGQRGQCHMHQGVVATEASTARPLQDLVHYLGGSREGR